MKKNTKEHSPTSVRTYDKDGYRRRAACVCVKDEHEAEVLLVSRPRQINQWIFPGGGIEPKEDPRHAASREVVEEAGVIGSIVRCLGIFETEHTRTCVYVLQVSRELTEWDDSINCGRTRMWFTIDEARSALGEGHAQLAYLERLKSSATITATTTLTSSSSSNSHQDGSVRLETHNECCCSPSSTFHCGSATSLSKEEDEDVIPWMDADHVTADGSNHVINDASSHVTADGGKGSHVINDSGSSSSHVIRFNKGFDSSFNRVPNTATAAISSTCCYTNKNYSRSYSTTTTSNNNSSSINIDHSNKSDHYNSDRCSDYSDHYRHRQYRNTASDHNENNDSDR